MLKYAHTTFFNRNYPAATRAVLYEHDFEVNKDGHFISNNMPCHCDMCSKQRNLIDALGDLKDKLLQQNLTPVHSKRKGICVVCHDHVDDVYTCGRCNVDQCYRCAYYGHIHSNPTCERKFKDDTGIATNITPIQFLLRNVSTKCPDMSLQEWYYCPPIKI